MNDTHKFHGVAKDYRKILMYTKDYLDVTFDRRRLKSEVNALLKIADGMQCGANDDPPCLFDNAPWNRSNDSCMVAPKQILRWCRSHLQILQTIDIKNYWGKGENEVAWWWSTPPSVLYQWRNLDSRWGTRNWPLQWRPLQLQRMWYLSWQGATLQVFGVLPCMVLRTSV